MKKHTLAYLNKYYPNFGPDDFIPCEACLILLGFSTKMVDVHHIENKGMGGSKLKDDTANLIGCCRYHHDIFHGLIKGEKISKYEQREIHQQFIKWQLGND